MTPKTPWLSGRFSVALLLAFTCIVLAGRLALAQAAPDAPAAAEPAAAAEAPAAPAAQGGLYVNPLWLGLTALAVALWLYAASWVCDDAKGAGMDYPKHTTIILGVGWLGLLLTLLVHAAMVFFMLAALFAAVTVYIVLRNRVVPEQHRLLGAYHRAALLERIPGLSKLASVRPRAAQRPTVEMVLASATGRTTDDVAAEQPALREAADVLSEFILRAGATRSRTLRFQPAGEQYVAQLVMDGVLHNVEALSADLANQVLAVAADLAGLARQGRMRQGAGEFSADLPAIGEASVRARIASAGGKPMLVLDLPDWTQDLYVGGLEPLGLHESIIKRLKATLTQKRGSLLVVGPRDSGKTTTLLALAANIDAFTVDVAFLGMAGRHKIEHVRDWDVPEDRPFADFYEELLREGPGAIVLDTLDQPGRAEKVLEFACEEGMVVGALEAPDAPPALTKLVELAGSADLVSRAVTCVLAQRLVRKLCLACREEVEPNPAMLQKLSIDPGDPGTWCRPVGCESCLRTGYQGRVGLFGMLILTEPVKKALLQPNATADAIRKAAGKVAFRTMYQDGIAKVTAGITTLDEVRRILKA